MSSQSTSFTPALYAYYQAIAARETDPLKELRQATLATGAERMQISPEQGQFLAFMVRCLGAQRILEVGTFTGYSALWMASALPDEGQLICCDVSEEWTSIGIPFWLNASVRERIDLRIAPALDTLNQLIDEGHSHSFDMVFIDADKVNYSNYYELSLQLLRTGGVVLIDNIFWSGLVADVACQDEDTEAIRDVTQHVHTDSRVDMSVLPIGDGLLLARKL